MPVNSRTVLITGGAGFIGSHLADRLLSQGYRVRVLDNLCPQVHGEGCSRPDYLDERVELCVGDVRDASAVRDALRDASLVYHLAAAVGVGQSMYQIEHYTDVNCRGTAVLLDALRERERPLDRLVVASSMSIYGEGLYRSADGSLKEDAHRHNADLQAGEWDCWDDGAPLRPEATPEWKRPSLASVYALSKYEQEQKCLMFGRAYGTPTVALRFFNAYGPRQALSNPYTGVIAIFASRLLNGRRPIIFEDGHQLRDFVSVHDIAHACELAGCAEGIDGEVFNIGSGSPVSILGIANELCEALGITDIEPEVSGEYRAGDIRHCYASIARASARLGYRPQWSLSRGLRELVAWLSDQQAEDGVEQMRADLRRRGLARTTTRPNRDAQNNGVSSHPGSASVGRRNSSTPSRPGVLITGGCGFIGSAAAQRLAGRGERVRLVDNFARNEAEHMARHLRDEFGDLVEIVEADVRDAAAMREAVRGVDRILHLAAQVAVTTSLADPVNDFDHNARGTLTVLDAMRCHAPDAHLILASTNKVYGTLEDIELTRRAKRYEPTDQRIARCGIAEGPLCFCSPYGCSKGAADQYALDYARSFGLATTSCRMSCIYGAGQFGTEDQGWVAHFVRSAASGRPLTVFGDGCQVRDLMYVADLVDAYEHIWAAAAETSGQAFNIGGGPARSVSVLELLDQIRASLGRDIDISFQPWRTADQRYFVADTSKLTRATGWEPRHSVERGLGLLTAWVEDPVAHGKRAAHLGGGQPA